MSEDIVMSLNKSAPIPLHYQLTNDLRDGIKVGMWGIGEVFPTDKELMEKYTLSSTTVRRAVSQLVQEGWLDRKPGRGTFVKKVPVEETLGRLTGFFDEMISHGFTPSAEVLSIREVEISDKELVKTPLLKEFNAKRMYLIEKIQKLNNEPMAHVISYWPNEYGARIAEYDLTSRGIYDVAKNELGVVLIRAEQIIGADIANKKVAQHLNVKVGSPILTMERIAFNDQNQPVELSINAYRADRYKYRAILEQSDQSMYGFFVTGQS